MTMGMEPELEIREELAQQRRMLQAMCDAVDRLEREVALCVNYARASAHAAGFYAIQKEEFTRLDGEWSELMRERKAANWP